MGLMLGAGLTMSIAILLAWAWVQTSESRRESGLETLARRLGLQFRSSLPPELREILPRFRDLERARDKGADFQAGINSMTGLWNQRRIAFFDYQWLVIRSWDGRRSWGSIFGDDDDQVRRTHRRSAVAIELGIPLQPLLIRPERLVDKALALVGYEDIDFDDLPEFSNAFYVNGPDRATARRLVTPALARFFMEHVRCTVDIVGPWMLLHPGERLSPKGVQPLLDLAGRLSELMTREQSAHR
jgi:hypothetical protein